jgi:KaiC/GvpD/RAD55 family RecA-like ATPase
MSEDKDKDKLKPKISFIKIGQMRENVQEKEIESESICTIATGYPVLDALLFGGIPQKFAVALVAPQCDEKDLIIKRFLKAGAENDESTFYVCIEPGLAGSLARNYPSTFNLFVCNSLAETLVKEALNVHALKGVENLTNLNITLFSALRKLSLSPKGTRRICLNVISDVLLQVGPVQTRKWLIELITQLKSVGFTTLAIINPQIHPPEDLNTVLSLFDGEICIREAETGMGFERYLRIRRMSDQKYMKDEACLTEEEQQDEEKRMFDDLSSRGYMKL